MTNPSAAAAESTAATAYVAAVESAQMRNIRLIKSEFVVQPEAMGGDRKGWKNGYGCRVSNTSFSAERNVATGMVLAEAYCKVGKKKIVHLKCSYLVAYDIDGSPEESAATRFVEKVGNFAVYPYFRAHFAELTSQAGVTMPPLPVMKEGRRVIPRD